MRNFDLITGLSEIIDGYDGIISDVWGVLHNGAVGYEAALQALKAARASGRPVVLITNAPRPAAVVADDIAKFGVTAAAYDAIVTSGDVTHALLAGETRRRVFHIGTRQNLTLFAGLGFELVEEATAEFVVATALYDDEHEQVEDYRPLFERLVARNLDFYCANPDVVVERGPRLFYCAGALAQLYAELGGKVIIAGKPHRPIYDAVLAKLSELAGRPLGHRNVLAIGDGFPTDIKGAWGQGIDVLMVTSGIHAADFGDPDHPDRALLEKRLLTEGLGIRAAIARLSW